MNKHELDEIKKLSNSLPYELKYPFELLILSLPTNGSAPSKKQQKNNRKRNMMRFSKSVYGFAKYLANKEGNISCVNSIYHKIKHLFKDCPITSIYDSDLCKYLNIVEDTLTDECMMLRKKKIINGTERTFFVPCGRIPNVWDHFEKLSPSIQKALRHFLYQYIILSESDTDFLE